MADQEPLSAKGFFEKQGRFSGLSQADQVLRTAWYIHTYCGRSRFQPKDITAFFGELHISAPNVHVNIKRLCEKKKKALMWDKAGYYMEGNCRRVFDDDYLIRDEPVRHLTSQSLKGIADKIAEPSQKTYLAEALSCYGVGAFRATIVMAWNLAYDHFTRWLIADHGRLTSFNTSLGIKYPKKSVVICDIDSFAELKEFDVIETAQHAKLISKGIGDVMRDKLKRRNTAAHPSKIVFTQAQADDVVTDLIHNVVAQL